MPKGIPPRRRARSPRCCMRGGPVPLRSSPACHSDAPPTGPPGCPDSAPGASAPSASAASSGPPGGS
eukprot:1110190-Prorocentrum_minimum.AAC.1